MRIQGRATGANAPVKIYNYNVSVRVKVRVRVYVRFRVNVSVRLIFSKKQAKVKWPNGPRGEGRILPGSVGRLFGKSTDTS